MAQFARKEGFEVEVAAFEAWDPAGRTSTPSLPGKPGTGWTRKRGAARPPRRCGPVADWPCSGMSSSPRPPWRTRSSPRPPRAAGLAVLRGDVRWPGRLFRLSPRQRTASGRWVDSACRNSGRSTGSGPTPGSSGWISSHLRRTFSVPTRAARRAAGGPRRRHRRGRRYLRHGLHHRGGHRGARRGRVTGTTEGGQAEWLLFSIYGCPPSSNT